MSLEDEQLRAHIREQLDTYKGYFEGQSRWMSAEEVENYYHGEELLISIRDRVYSNPKVKVVSETQTLVRGVGEYDYWYLAVASKKAIYHEEPLNDLGHELFDGFFDPSHNFDWFRGGELKHFFEAGFSDVAERYKNKPDLSGQEIGLGFPWLAKRRGMALAVRNESFNLAFLPAVSVPGEAMEFLSMPPRALYKPFLWRHIVVTLFPDEQVANLHLRWKQYRDEQPKSKPPSQGFRVIGVWEMPELKDYGIDSISHGIYFEMYRKWREGKNLIEEYFPEAS